MTHMHKKSKTCPDCRQPLDQPARPVGHHGSEPVWCAYCEDSRPADPLRLVRLVRPPDSLRLVDGAYVWGSPRCDTMPVPDPPRPATPICRDIDGIQGEHDWQPAVAAHARILDADRLKGVITTSHICGHCGMTSTLDTRADGGQRTAYRDAAGYLVNEQVMSVPMATAAPRRWQSPIPQDAPPEALTDLLRSLIAHAGITQGAAARLLGVAPRTVRGWLEAGKRRRQVTWSSVELLRRRISEDAGNQPSKQKGTRSR